MRASGCSRRSAVADHEVVEAARRRGVDVDGGDARGRRAAARASSRRNASSALPVAFERGSRRPRRRSAPSRRACCARARRIDERAEADALHHAAHANRAGARHRPSTRSTDAAAALPADLHDRAVFDQHRHRALAAGQRAHAVAAPRGRLDVVLDEVDAVASPATRACSRVYGQPGVPNSSSVRHRPSSSRLSRITW